MNRQDILAKISRLKPRYEREGIALLGLFGSFARGDETPGSDVDILFACNSVGKQRYPDWSFYPFLERVRQELESELGRPVDLAEMDALNETGRKHILPEVLYVP